MAAYSHLIELPFNFRSVLQSNNTPEALLNFKHLTANIVQMLVIYSQLYEHSSHSIHPHNQLKTTWICKRYIMI